MYQLLLAHRLFSMLLQPLLLVLETNDLFLGEGVLTEMCYGCLHDGELTPYY